METTTRSESNKVQNQNLEAYGFLEVISGQFDNRGVIIPYQVSVSIIVNMSNYCNYSINSFL